MQATLDQLAPYEVQEVHVQSQVHKQVDHFFDPVPDLVETDPKWTDLHTGRYPDDVDTDINEADGDEKRELQHSGVTLVRHDQGNSIGNDLEETLRLYSP